METDNYSLEKHLEAICNDDKDYEILIAVWRLNKENLAAALKNIASVFPHYSQHDISHSITILDNIQRLLGRDRVERLGATDTFLLLMSALTHDLGMYMTYEMVEKEWGKPEIKKLIESYAKSSDKIIASAANLLQEHYTRPANVAEGFKWALAVRNAVTILLAHQMRRGHGDRSAELLEKSDFFRENASRFHFESLPERYLTLIAQVAHLHGTDFNEVMNLPQKATGFKSDFVHPRFIASMIRMGDLLDIDNNRFNPYSLAMVKDVPESSRAHYDKHQALKHLLISPEGIEVDLNCPTEASYRVAREMFDWLESEVANQCREWNIIAPPDLGGLPPVLHKDKINIFYKGTRPRHELRNLRFDISSQRTFEMLKGGAIYHNPGRVFLREIVQNALDATKLQIWRDMDIHLPFNMKNPARQIQKREDIRFSDDIPSFVYEKYPIDLKVDYNKEQQTITVICEDWGTGISEESLIRMTSQVGSSRKADKGYEKTINGMPYFLQPTASFGLGLQTIFYVADEFTVDTQYPGEPSRRIVFRTSSDGSYCSINEEGFVFSREKREVLHGSTVKIVIDKEHWKNFFEINQENVTELLDNTDAVEYRLAEYIDFYAKYVFQDIGSIPLRYHSLYGSFESKRERKDYEYVKEEGNFRLYWKWGHTEFPFIIEKAGKMASRIKISFKEKNFKEDDQLLLRSIPITSTYSGNYFVTFYCDLWCREADSLVTLSRNGLLPQGRKWFISFRDSLISDCLGLIYEPLRQRLIENPEDQSALEQYAYFCVANWIHQSSIEPDLAPMKDYRLSTTKRHDLLCIDKTGAAVSIKQMLESEKLVISSYNSSLERDVKSNDALFHEDEIIVRGIGYDIPNSYYCSEVFSLYYGSCYRLIKGNSNDFHLVEHSNYDITELDMRHETYDIRFKGGDKCYWGFQRYKEIVVGKSAPLLDHRLPLDNINCWIYPITRAIKDDLPKSREEAEKYLFEKGRLETLVPEYIVKLIQIHNALGDKNLTKETIYKKYAELILDNQFGYKETKVL